MKLYNQAIKDFSEAIALNLNNAFFYYGRGSAYLRKGLYNKAIQDFTRAIDLNPTKDKFYQQRGLAYLGKCLYEKATEDFSKAIELYPHNPEYYRSRGIAYELMELIIRQSPRRFQKSYRVRRRKKEKK
jgi:tetratricopeptide (TPR) repeat protein